jgi:hypothetical protein
MEISHSYPGRSQFKSELIG